MSNKDFIGKKFNNWEVIDWVIGGRKEVEWICRCKCGNIKQQKVDNIKNGRSKMCKECANKRRSGKIGKKYNIYGKEMTSKEIKERYGISQQLFNYRIKKGMSNEEAVETEIKLGKRYDKR